MLLPLYQAGSLTLPDGANLPYLTFGNGPLPFLIIPGGSDGWATVADSAPLLAWFHRSRARSQRLLLLSRRQPIPANFTAEQYALDFLWAMDQLQWERAVVECNSAGGPIGQLMAVKAPHRVSGLVLQCTAHRADRQARLAIRLWALLARQQRWSDLIWSTLEYGLQPQTARRARAWRPCRPLLGLFNRPRDGKRLSRVFEGLLAIDNRPILPHIVCPTLVIGGEEDRIFSARLQREMAALIPNSRLILYPGHGHLLNRRQSDYAREVDAFGRAVWQLAEPVEAGFSPAFG